LLILIGVAILDYIDFAFWKKNSTSIWQQSTIIKQAKIIDSDNLCTIVTQKRMWEKNINQYIQSKKRCSALWKTIKKLVITNFTKRCNIKKYWHGNHKKCSQKGFLTQLWHQKICRTQLWQKYICEKVYGGKNLTITNICAIVLAKFHKMTKIS
jgi:hypothetical protein